MVDILKNLDSINVRPDKLLELSSKITIFEDIIDEIPVLPDPGSKKRNMGCFYIFKGNKMYWNGKEWLCEHKVTRTRCKKCNGSGFCVHDKRTDNCLRCGKSQQCQHGKRKNICVKCKGSSICRHGKRKQYCRECGGVSICEHGSQKYNCIRCNGKGICQHGKKKHNCHVCVPFYRKGEYQKYVSLKQ